MKRLGSIALAAVGCLVATMLVRRPCSDMWQLVPTGEVVGFPFPAFPLQQQLHAIYLPLDALFWLIAVAPSVLLLSALTPFALRSTWGRRALVIVLLVAMPLVAIGWLFAAYAVRGPICLTSQTEGEAALSWFGFALAHAVVVGQWLLQLAQQARARGITLSKGPAFALGGVLLACGCTALFLGWVGRT
jgi:hypothetical protein